VGVGLTALAEHRHRTAAGLAAEALVAALADSGLSREDIDGFVWNMGRPSGEDYDRLMENLGLRTRFSLQFWTHGRFMGASLSTAAMAIQTGQADIVACIGGLKRAGSDPANWGVPHPGHDRYGMHTFTDEAALTYRRYLELYDVPPERLADVVLASRAYGALNEQAMLREPMTVQDYLDAPFWADPLRTVDCAPMTAAGVPRPAVGVCVLIARSDLAAGLRKPPVHIAAYQGIQAGRDEVYWGRPGLGLFTQTTSAFTPSAWDLAVYERAGVTPGDVDGVYIYDVFSSLVWLTLERLGHCEPGTASSWASQDRIGPGGAFPVNTNGGMLSEGHTAGWGQVVELTRQLRHEAGPRQIPDASLLQWAAIFGDSILFTNEQR
jgi:acetyl-CoA acetyltransferase